MSETVEGRLEQFVPTFEQLITLGIFSRDEVKAIIKKRRNFESSLVSRNADLSAYLKYIEYEAAVVALTDKRKIIRGIESNDRLLSDSAWPKHIHSIFRRACHRFSGDMTIWNLYFKYCQDTRSVKMLSSALGECIKLHSNDPDLWIRAASWEMNENGNCELAMKYMAQSIELIPENPKLYSMYAETVLYQSTIIEQRREIAEVQEKSDILKAPLEIFKHALSKCPDQSSVLRTFIETFKKYEQPIEQLISLAQDTKTPSVLSVISETSDDPIQKYESYISSLKDSNNPKLRELEILYANYLTTLPPENKKAISKFISILNEIGDFNDTETELYTKHLLDCGELSEASSLLEDELTTLNLKLLKLRLIDLQNPSFSAFKSAAGPFIRAYPGETSLISYYIRAIAGRDISSEDWISILTSEGPKATPLDCAKALTLTLAKYGPKVSNIVLSPIMNTVIPIPELLEAARNIVKSQEVIDTARLRGLYEIGYSRWPQNVDMWIEACRFEFEEKNWKKMESIRWKAKAALENPGEFEKRYQIEFCKNK